MPYPSLPLKEVFKIRSLFQETRSLTEVCNLTGYNWRTIKRYANAPNRQKTDRNRVAELYKATGRLSDVAEILSVSTTTVWRALKEIGINIGPGSKTWKRLYKTLRQRVYKSDWRASILERDGHRCQKCGESSEHVHHEIHLAQIRNNVLKNHPELNPLDSYQELRKFTDLVMYAHKDVPGIVVCSKCHDNIHSGFIS